MAPMPLGAMSDTEILGSPTNQKNGTVKLPAVNFSNMNHLGIKLLDDYK